MRNGYTIVVTTLKATWQRTEEQYNGVTKNTSREEESLEKVRLELGF